MKIKYNMIINAADTENINETDDYSKILEKHTIPFKAIDYYLHVGKIIQTQGWILHISVVKWQVPELLEAILPTLVTENVPFKIVKDKETVRLLLDGNIEHSQVGKVISIYPSTNDLAMSIARKLITLTHSFRGPVIPTDAHLGGCVYTRYGSFNPIILADEYGNLRNFIYDNMGNLIPDCYTTPFAIPNGIEWPFNAISKLRITTSKRFLNSTYKPISILKSDVKGNVFKAVYIKGLFRIGFCVVKEGKKDMWSDAPNRAMPERLLWQKEIHENLLNKIPIPKIIDSFYNEGNMYLVMEYIKGKPLLDEIFGLNSNHTCWTNLPQKAKLIVVNYIQQLINLIGKFHEHGYVHRDVTPVNFIVSKHKILYSIDNELSYSLMKGEPMPPFQLGTDGFMSPEQSKAHIPTKKEDIYSIGATMIISLTGLPPQMFQGMEMSALGENLFFFLGDRRLSNAICACLNPIPDKRALLSELLSVLELYKTDISKNRTLKAPIPNIQKIDQYTTSKIINSSLNGLTSYPTLLYDGLWQSKITSYNNINEKEAKVFCLTGGLCEGISGILYVLAKASQNNFDISRCKEAYKMGWEYLQNNYLCDIPNVAAGLYSGAAGLAIALSSGIDANLVENNQINRSLIHKCLSISINDISMMNGIPGQGLALFQCIEYLELQQSNEIFQRLVNVLLIELTKEEKNTLNQFNKGNVSAGLSHGHGGSLYFLLEYLSHFKNTKIEEVILSLLKGLRTRSKLLQLVLRKKGIRKIFTEFPQIFDDITGTILISVKAYELLKDQTYKILAESLLYEMPDFIVYDNLSQRFGLSDLGEVYLEAYAKLGNEYWLTRANWISQVIIHSSCKNLEGSHYWYNRNSSHVTAGLMTGCSGIVHFLLKYSNPNGVGYRVLSK